MCVLAENLLFVEGIRVSNHAGVFRGIIFQIFLLKNCRKNNFSTENEQVVVSNDFYETPVISRNYFGKVRKFELTSYIKALLKIFLVQNQAYLVGYVHKAMIWPKIEETYR